MAHVRPEPRIAKHRASACRKGRHQYGAAQYIGAGLARQVCEACGAVTIDLTSVDETLDTPLLDSHQALESSNGKES